MYANLQLVQRVYRHIDGDTLNLTELSMDAAAAHAVVECLAQQPQLHTLRLRGTAPTLEALEMLLPSLRQTKRIRTLDLSACGIRPRLAQALLAVVDLRGGDHEGPAPPAGRPPHLPLTTLVLSGNPLGLEGARVLAPALVRISVHQCSAALQTDPHLFHQSTTQHPVKPNLTEP
jgi:hypothetical protein